MSCDRTGPVEGGSYLDVDIYNPTVNGGEINGSTINGGVINGPIVLDAAALASILNALLTTCAGSSHTVGGAVPTCAELETAIANVFASVASRTPNETVGNELPTVIIGRSSARTGLMGRPDGYLEIEAAGQARLVPYYDPLDCE